MKKVLFSLLFSAAIVNVFSQKLVSYELLADFSQDSIASQFNEKKVPKSIIPAKYGVDVYEIIYMTQWHDGTPIKASGFYYVPKTDAPRPLIGYHHGTRIVKAQDFAIKGEEMICTIFGTSGYAVAEPHYIGLGKGEKFHLYHHVETEAYSTIDMFRAIRELNEKLGVKSSGDIFLTGYSQGGHATMAAHKIIQERYADEFNIIASSPMSGAYDLTGAQAQAMFVNYSHPGYLPYLLIAMNEVYGIYEDVAIAFKPPYDKELPPMYNGLNSMRTINKSMPSIPSDIIKDEFLKLFQDDPTFKLRQALEENSTHNWKPEAPMQICYCEGDEQVFYKNAIVTYENMKALGAENIRLKRVGKTFGHNTCAVFATGYTKFYFDSFLKGSEKGRKGPVFKRLLISLGKMKAKRSEKKKEKREVSEQETVAGNK